MPRSRVRPEDRQRSCKACLACKTSKIRCDSQLPCASCIRRDRAASCVYSEADRRRRHHSLNHHQKTSRPGVESLGTVVPAANPYNASPQNAPRTPSLSTRPVTPDPSADGASSPQLPASDRGSVRSRGDRVYVDETASSSFLHFLRKTLRPYVGSVSFTDGERHHTIFEEDIADVRSDGGNTPPVEIYSLLESYFEATSGLLNLFTADEIDALIAERASPEGTASPSSIRRDDAAALDAAVAIGAQVRGSSDEYTQLARSHFCHARRVAFEGMLTKPSLGMVRLFLLLSFYMLGACNRNAASMYLGVAAKATVVLGLHHLSSHKNLQKEDYCIRLRTWNSIRNIDILTSFILGRSKSLPPVRHNTNEMEMSREASPQDTQSVFTAILKGSSLLEDIVNKLSKGNMLHVPTAEGLLEQLRQWSRALPPTLRQFTSTSGDGSCLDFADRQLLAGNIHLSCVYYFAVILITRPFLIAYLMSRLRGRAPDQLISDPEEATDVRIKNNTVSKLAQVCVSSAVYMADTCAKAKASNFTFGNLCMLKAWIFGAGLVLGFSMFAGEPRRDIEDAFEGACGVLQSIGASSAQARLYHEILTSLAEAVKKYHNRVSGEVSQTVERYIDKILILDVPRDAGQHHSSVSSAFTNGNLNEPQLAGATSNAHGSVFAVNAEYNMEGAQTLVDMAVYGGIQGEGGEFDLQLANDFMVDVEPFEKLFYSVE